MDPFVGEIRIVPFTFAPRGWAHCDGQLLPIIQHTALFSLLGTRYGGDGTSTFALPDLRGRVPMHPGEGPGLSPHVLGERGGSEAVTLVESEIPPHTHELRATTDPAELQLPASDRTLARTTSAATYAPPSAQAATLAPQALAAAGGGEPHNNMMPSLTLTFCIALEGIYPERP
jgi:microcystin-dependent protein